MMSGLVRLALLLLEKTKRENRVSAHTRLGIMHNRNWNVRNGGKEEYSITKIFNCRVHVRNITCP
jgi:hypothetical protein